MDEGCFKRPPMGLVLDILGNGVIPVEVDENARHLEFSGKAVDRCRKDIFLSMAVEKDLLSEPCIPVACDNLGDIGCEDIFINGNRSWNSDVMIGMSSKPDRL